MKSMALLAACAAVLGSANAIRAQGNAGDEQAVRQVLRNVREAQSARDFKKFGQFFAEDAEFVNVSATYAKGRDAVVKMHERALNGVFKNVDFKALEAQMPEPSLAVRFLRPDVAIVHMELAPGECPPCRAAAEAMHMAPPNKDARQVMIWVLSKHDGQWLIDAAQNTVSGLTPNPPAAAPK